MTRQVIHQIKSCFRKYNGLGYLACRLHTVTIPLLVIYMQQHSPDGLIIHL